MTARTSSASVFSPLARRLVWIVAGVSAIGTVIAILFGARVAEPTPTERDSFTHGPVGHRAFVETLEALDVHVVREQRGPFGDVRAPMLFVEPGLEATVGDERLALDDAIAAQVAGQRETIVVLPKWRWAPGLPGRAVPDDAAADVLAAVLPGATLAYDGAPTDELREREARGTLGHYQVTVPWPQLIVSSTAEVLLSTAHGAVAVRRADGVIVVSDPDLLHSWNLHRGDHALFWSDLITHHLSTDTVAIDEVFHGHFARPSLGAALAAWPTVTITAQVLLLALLVVLLGSARFGPIRARSALGRGPAESIAVSAHVLGEGRPIGALTDAYVRAQIADMAERLGLPPGKTPAEQARHVDAVAKRRGETPDAERLLAAATSAAASEGARATESMALARRAHALRERLLKRGNA